MCEKDEHVCPQRRAAICMPLCKASRGPSPARVLGLVQRLVQGGMPGLLFGLLGMC